jgi:Terminase small subunit
MARSTAKMPTGGRETGLTDRELQFCRHYARCFKGAEAYSKAGYKPTTRSTQDVEAYRLLKKPKIQEYLGTLLDVDETTITTAVTAIAFTPITDILKWDGKELTVKQTELWSERAKLAVKKVTFKQTFDKDTGEVTSNYVAGIEMYDRLSALDKLMRMLSMFPAGQSIASSDIESPTNEYEVNTEYERLNNSPAGRFFRDITGTQLSTAAISKTMDAGPIAVEN